MCHLDVASVLSGCCKSRSGYCICCKCLSPMFHGVTMFHAYVASFFSVCCICFAIFFQVFSDAFCKCFRRMFQVFHLSSFCMLQVLYLDVLKVDLDVAYVCTTSGARQGCGVAETSTEVNGARWGMAARQGRAAASDVRASFHYAGTDALAQIVFLPVSSDAWNHNLGAMSGRVLAPGVRTLAVSI